jgi:uncharacterized protein YaaN involved in tellurite resistance
MSTALKTNDVNSILNFGAELQNNLAKYSDTFLNSVKAFDAGEIGISITDLLTEINYIDIDPSENGTFKRILLSIPGLKNLVMNTKKIFQKYDTISGNIDGIIKKLEKGKLTILKDNVNLQNLFEQNLMYINKLEELIIGGQIKYNELESELSAMESNIAEYQDYEISDKREFLTRLSKRLTDMQITRTITIQSLPQIRLVQNNNVTMVEKIQSSVTTTIPIWKNQISIAVALMRQKGILDVQKKISDTTNLILNKNAEMLKQNSIDVAKENEKTIVSMETLHNVNQKLIETLTEVKRIKEEGEASRRDVAKQLESLEKELKANVLQLK